MKEPSPLPRKIQLIKEWEAQVVRLEEAKKAVRDAQLLVQNAANKIGHVLYPTGAIPGESVTLWLTAEELGEEADKVLVIRREGDAYLVSWRQ